MRNEVAWYLTSLTRLMHLNVADCPQLDDACLPAIWALTALTHLSLSSTRVAGLSGTLFFGAVLRKRIIGAWSMVDRTYLPCKGAFVTRGCQYF